MYTEEEFDGLQEAEKTQRTYVSSVAQDPEKLLRENEKLKKGLEKEKFFNKLLDQELKELKTELSRRLPVDHVPPSRGVSKGAFYTVLFLFIAVTAFLAYTLYFDKQYHLFSSSTPAPQAAAPVAATEENEESLVTAPAEEVPALTDSVPDIVMTEPVVATPPKAEEPVATKSAEQKATTPTPQQTQPASQTTSQKNTTTPAAPAAAKTNSEPVNITPTPPPPSRPVIAKYRVSSKANFYTAPDENALGRSFINGGNKTVDAYEDSNGFIYVEYVNEYGMTIRGWLSKKDLTPIE